MDLTWRGFMLNETVPSCIAVSGRPLSALLPDDRLAFQCSPSCLGSDVDSGGGRTNGLGLVPTSSRRRPAPPTHD